jgi:LacI family transcriptional regulator
MQASRRVAVCVDKSRSYGRGVLRGIAEYVETRGRWSLYLDPRASGSYGADWLRGWDGDGVLAFIDDPALATSLRRARIPTVELFGHRLDLGLAHVGNDEEDFGRLAAAHLLERPVYAWIFD